MTGWLEGTPLAAIPGAVEAGIVSGLLLPWLGMWVVLLRIVFLGVTLAQVAAAGVALGLALHWPPLPMGLALTLLVVAAVVRSDVSRSPLAADGRLGALFCVASALALLFVSRSAADLDEVQHVLHGNLIYASHDVVFVTAATLVAAVALLSLFFKQLLLVGFDQETAQALGLSTRRWTLLLFSVLATVLTVSMRTTGSLLTFAMLVLPALAALSLRQGLLASFVLASVLGGLGTLAGLLLAVHADLHVESSITVSLFVLLPICGAWRRSSLLGAALAVLAVVVGWSLAPIEREAESAHPHHHDEPVVEAWHVDVELSAERSQDGDAIVVSWLLTMHRLEHDVVVPAELWIVLTGGDVMHEHMLTDELTLLPAGKTTLRGTCLVPAGGPLHRLEGQLWTGPMSAVHAKPIDIALGLVLGADVR